jgi:hypothetical protein
MTKLEKQIARTVKAARDAQRQSEKLVQELTKVDVDDALRIGEVFRLHAQAATLLEDELSDMALWDGDAPENKD